MFRLPATEHPFLIVTFTAFLRVAKYKRIKEISFGVSCGIVNCYAVI